MSNKIKKEQGGNQNKIMQLVIGGAVALIVIVIAIYTTINKGNEQVASNTQNKVTSSSSTTQATTNQTTAAQTTVGGDLVIPIAGVSEKASFYKYTTSNGTNLEVIAVKASDGTIRTAFNTCQVCYSSGRGYYIVQGSYLVCQNCGNKFKADQVQVTKGGCNPVPIFSEDKTVDSSNITITKDFLESSQSIFSKWKS